MNTAFCFQTKCLALFTFCLSNYCLRKKGVCFFGIWNFFGFNRLKFEASLIRGFKDSRTEGLWVAKISDEESNVNG